MIKNHRLIMSNSYYYWKTDIKQQKQYSYLILQNNNSKQNKNCQKLQLTIITF